MSKSQTEVPSEAKAKDVAGRKKADAEAPRNHRGNRIGATVKGRRAKLAKVHATRALEELAASEEA